MRPTHSLLLLVLGLSVTATASADDCGDLATRFSGAERFSMKIADLDELKTCINILLREKISATSNEARGSTSPTAVGGESPVQLSRPKSVPVLQDAE
ncbi:MAG: hypothetical protein ACRERR_05375 [Moraxellaceae bacterium]